MKDLNGQLKKEADEILFHKGLFDILKKYGRPHVTGSYELELMVWRDLDIYLEAEDMSEDDFFSLGAEINKLLFPVRMSFRNERIMHTKGLPTGLYWGIYLGNERMGAWKIDVWAIDEQECHLLLKYCDDIAKNLTNETRDIILAIKSACWQDPEYRRSFSSKDIYEAVLDSGITSVEDFRKYLLSPH